MELTIKDIKNIDSGPYICEARNKAGRVTNQTFMQVFGKYCLVWLSLNFSSNLLNVKFLEMFN